MNNESPNMALNALCFIEDCLSKKMECVPVSGKQPITIKQRDIFEQKGNVGQRIYVYINNISPPLHIFIYRNINEIYLMLCI